MLLEARLIISTLQVIILTVFYKGHDNNILTKSTLN